MKHPGPLFFSCCLLGSACPQGGETGGGQPGPAVDTSSSSASGVTDSTFEAPTTAGGVGATTTGVVTDGSAATSSSGAADGDTAGDTADTGGSASGATGASTEDCGNGALDPGEGCDDGYAVNSDDAACTLACQPASCGDGHVWAGHEVCDLGPNNNDSLYDGCTTQCAAGPACNDGEVQGPEECDAGPANGTGTAPEGGVACDSGCRFAARLVFVTSELYTGGMIGGAEGADLKCRALAMKAGFDNALGFKAYISDGGSSPAGDGFTHSTLPYVLPNGVRVADDWNDLILNSPQPGIHLTDTGETVDELKVWTGTTPSGNMFPGQTCQNWTSSAPTEKGRVGLTSPAPAQAMMWIAEKQWVSHASFGCDLPFRLYCVEQ